MNEHVHGLASAVQDFERARQQAGMEHVVAALTGKSPRLLPYEEVRQKLKARETTLQTLQEIPLDAIVGSVGRYSDFTRSFLPLRDTDEERWARVKLASDLHGLPPIEVYQIDQAYFVLDGHHRVSVARQLGATHIQAYVTRVETKVPLTPTVGPDDLIVKAEYADFLERTGLDGIRPDADLTVTVPGQYRLLAEHIAVHRYWMGQEHRREIPPAEAAAHWYDTVYMPVVRVIRELGVLWDFPARTETDLYVWVSEHRAALEEKLGWAVGPEKAASDLAARFSPTLRRMAARLGNWLLQALVPKELAAGPPPGEWRRLRQATRRDDHLFDDLLVAVNGRETGWPALEQALLIAGRGGAHLNGLYVVPAAAQESAQVQMVVDEFERRCRAAGVDGELVVAVGEVTRCIYSQARWTDLLVLSLNHPPGARPISRLSSGLSTIIRRCPRPILTVPAGSLSSLERPLLAYDGSPKAAEALFVATYLAGRWNAPLTVVTVATRYTSPTMLDRARQYLDEHDVAAAYFLRRKPIGEAILSVAEEQRNDLIVMGGYGYGPLLEVVHGSAVDQVLRRCSCPLLICR